MEPEKIYRMLLDQAEFRHGGGAYTSRYEDMLEDVVALAYEHAKEDVKHETPPSKRKSKSTDAARVAELEDTVEMLQDQLTVMQHDYKWLNEHVTDIQAQRDEWRTLCVQTSQEMVKSAEESTQNLLILALHFAEKQSEAVTLGAMVTELIEHLELLLSDAPEPATFAMLDGLKEQVQQLSAPPSERVMELLARQGISEKPTGKSSKKKK